jgi:hypothetical protein
MRADGKVQAGAGQTLFVGVRRASIAPDSGSNSFNKAEKSLPAVISRESTFEGDRRQSFVPTKEELPGPVLAIQPCSEIGGPDADFVRFVEPNLGVALGRSRDFTRASSKLEWADGWLALLRVSRRRAQERANCGQEDYCTTHRATIRQR